MRIHGVSAENHPWVDRPLTVARSTLGNVRSCRRTRSWAAATCWRTSPPRSDLTDWSPSLAPAASARPVSAWRWQLAEASAFADGIWLANLVPISDDEWVAHAVADAFGIRIAEGADPTDALVTDLADRQALLVLDNCEHVIDGATELVQRLLERLSAPHDRRDEPPTPPPERRVGRSRAAARRCHRRRGPLHRPGGGGRSTRSTMPITSDWPASALDSTASRWPSSWRPLACATMTIDDIDRWLSERFRLLREGEHGAPITRRSRAPSSGPMTCSTTGSSGSSPACACSPATSIWHVGAPALGDHARPPGRR